MNTQLKRLNRILRVLDPGMFYAISVYKGSITMQGKFDPESTLKLSNYHFDKKGIDTSGYMSYEKKNLRIILT